MLHKQPCLALGPLTHDPLCFVQFMTHHALLAQSSVLFIAVVLQTFLMIHHLFGY